MADKPESKKPELSFYGLKADDVSPAMRPVFDAYAMAEQELVDRKRIQQKASLPTKKAVKTIDQKLADIRAQQPSEKTRDEMQKAVAHKRRLWEGGGSWGQTALDDQQRRLGRILKKRNVEDTEETRQKLLDDLIKSAKEKGGKPARWDAFDPVFDRHKTDRLDNDAMEVLNVWSMQNLATKFTSPTELWDNFSRIAKEQEALSKEAEELIQEKLKTEKPKEVRFAIVDGKKVAAIPRFGEGVDEALGGSMKNRLLRLLYKDKTPRNVLDMYAKGMALGQDRAAVVEALGNERDADRLLTNAFFATESALPSEAYVPVSITPDGRFPIDRTMMKLGIENLLFDKKRIERGLSYGEMGEEEAEQIREEARAEATKLTAVLDKSDTLVAHVDPTGARRDYLEGRGWRANLLALQSVVNTYLTTGQDEWLFNDVPDRVTRGLIALTLPRKTAGIVTRLGEHEDYLKEGEFFGPALGDWAVPNTLDFALRLVPDEAVATSFVLAVDDEAKQHKEAGVGTPLRVVKNMANNFGEDRHVVQTSEDAFAGGRFLTEAGDVLINPFLGEWGKKHPLPGQLAGGVGVFILMLASPGPLEGVQVGAAGVKGAKKRIKMKLTTGEMDLAAARLDAQIASVDETVGPIADLETPEQVTKYLDTLGKLMDQDKTGGIRTLDVLASFATLERAGLVGGRGDEGGEQLRMLMGAYDQLKTKSEKLTKEADEDLLNAKKTKNPTRSLMRYLDAATKKLGAHGDYLEAEAVITQALKSQHVKNHAESVAETIVGLSKLEKENLQYLLKAFYTGEDMLVLKALPPLLRETILTKAGKDAAHQRRLLRQWGAKEASRLLGKGRPHKRAKTGKQVEFQVAKSALSRQLAKYDVSVARLEKYMETVADELLELTKGAGERLAKELGVKFDDLKDAEKMGEVAGVGRKLHGKYFELLKAQGTLLAKYRTIHKDVLAAKRASEELAKMSPEEIDKLRVKAAKDYVAELRRLSRSVQEVARINPKVFEDAQEFIRGKDRAAAKEAMGVGSVLNPDTLEMSPLLGPATREGGVMARKLNLDGLEGQALREALENVTDDLFLTDTLIKIFTDPYGVAQFSRNRALKKDGILGLFTNWKSWAVYGTLQLKLVYRKFPIFSTNLRLLESTVSKELDDLHKEMAREANNIRDGFNLIGDNAPEDANHIIFSLLTSPGRVTHLTSRYRIPFTPAQKITLDGTAGWSESPIRMFFKNGVAMARTLDIKTSVPMGDMPGLDAFISNLVAESTLQKRNQFVSDLRLPLREMVLRSFLKMHKDGSAGAMSDSELFLEMITRTRAQISSDKIARKPEAVGFKDKKGRPAIMARGAGKIYNSIVLGALLEKQAARMNSITGSRFTVQQAEGLNRQFGDSPEPISARDITVGSYVVLSEDIEYAKRLASTVFNEAGDATGRGVGVSSIVRTEELGGTVSPLGLFTAGELRHRLNKLPKTARFNLDTFVAGLDPSVTKRILNRAEFDGWKEGDMYPSVHAVTDWLANNSRSDVYQRLAQYLLPFTRKDSPLQIGSTKADESGRSYAWGGVAVRGGAISEDALIHEIIHHTIHNWLSTMTPDLTRLKAGKAQTVEFMKMWRNIRNRSRVLFETGDFYRLNKNGRELLVTLGVKPEDIDSLSARISYALRIPAELPAVMLTEPDARRFLEVIRLGTPEPGKGLGFADVLTDILDVPKEIRSAFRDLARRKSRVLTEDPDLAPHGAPKVAKPGVQRVGRARPTKDVRGVHTPEDPKLAASTRYEPGKPKKQKPGWRSPILERLSGAPAYRVNKIEKTKRGATAYYLNAADGSGRPLILTRSEIEMRPAEFTILDLVDGASILGLESLTQAGRKAVTKEMADARIAYQQLVLTGVDEFGNVRTAPRTMVNSLIQSFDRIERELGEAISPEVAQSGLMRGAPEILATSIRLWKTHILTGLAVPRPAYFSNEIFGNFAQMVDSVGFAQAGQLSLMGSMAYVPFYGKALQDAYINVMSKHGGQHKLLPFAFSAMFNTPLQKIMSGSDELMDMLPDGTRPTYAQFLNQANRGGINESIITPDFSKVLREMLAAQMDDNPTLYRTLKKNGQDLAYFQRIMQIKIKEVTRRQRLLFYSHLRINKGMTHDAAKLELANTLYDWTFSVGKMEMKFLGRFVLFYTLVKNAMAQVSRSFLEFSDVGAAEYTRRFARGATKSQRMELMSRLMTAEMFDKPGPFEELTEEQLHLRAAMVKMPDYLSEYPILALGYMPPAALEIMSEGGFVRTNYARTLPKFTTTEFLMNYMDIVGSLSAIVAAFGNVVDPQGKVFPYSTNANKSIKNLVEITSDQFLSPIYGDIAETMALDLLGQATTPQSTLGRRARPGDLAMLKLLGQFGLADSTAIIDDEQKPGIKRIVGFWSSPWVQPIYNIPKTELHRLRMMVSVAFPGMAPAEIRALAETDRSAGVRLELLAHLLNVGKAVFYNGNDESYYELKEVEEAYSRLDKRLRGIVETPVGGTK